jgi:hypothetical protein
MKKILAIAILVAISLLTAPRAHGFDHDVRPLAMRAVFEKYNSPMLGYENELIAIAEKHNLDWTLLAAIAGTESSFGKRMPANCLNPYGWGIYGNNKLCFNSFPEAAEAVAKGLSTRYNTSSLESIGRTYNKVSTEGWINHTKFFMNKIKNASIPVSSLPITL